MALSVLSQTEMKNKQIVLIANTSFYNVPVALFNEFNALKVADLTRHMFTQKFNFSVITPRLIQPLKQLYEQASGQKGFFHNFFLTPVGFGSLKKQ